MGATGDVPKRMIELLKGMKSYVSQTLGETEGQTPLTLKDFPSVSDLEDEDWFTVDDLLAAFADIKTRPHLMDIFKSKHGWKAHFKINGAIYKYFQALENGRLPVAPPSSAPQKTEEAADPPTPQHEPFSAVELAVPTVATIRAAVSPLPTLPRAEASDSSAEGCFSYAEQLPQQQQQQQQCESRPFVNPLFDDGGAPSGSDGSGTAGVVAASCWEEATPSAPPPAVVCTRRYAGISNQGATCYLNSLLQSMVHIPYFRAEMYKMQVDDGGSGTAADADNGDAAADQDMRGPSVDDAASGSASGSGSDLPDGKRRRLDGGSDEDCGGGGDDDGRGGGVVAEPPPFFLKEKPKPDFAPAAFIMDALRFSSYSAMRERRFASLSQEPPPECIAFSYDTANFTVSPLIKFFISSMFSCCDDAGGSWCDARAFFNARCCGAIATLRLLLSGGPLPSFFGGGDGGGVDPRGGGGVGDDDAAA
eukprot:Rhum_TRINITY_DN14357_c19_g1::Rhum_TRINITY_DN14357_c19_g1_i1::g.84176::m.84176